MQYNLVQCFELKPDAAGHSPHCEWTSPGRCVGPAPFQARVEQKVKSVRVQLFQSQNCIFHIKSQFAKIAQDCRHTFKHYWHYSNCWEILYRIPLSFRKRAVSGRLSNLADWMRCTPHASLMPLAGPALAQEVKQVAHQSSVKYVKMPFDIFTNYTRSQCVWLLQCCVCTLSSH